MRSGGNMMCSVFSQDDLARLLRSGGRLPLIAGLR
jgi:hypothetical protein